MTSEQIKQNYMNYVVKHPNQWHTLFRFASTMGIASDMVQEHFSNAKEIEQSIWADFFTETLTQLSADPELYEGYTSREKMLSFFYTLEETLQKHRPFIEASFSKSWFNLGTPDCLKQFETLFLSFANQLITQGLDTQEIEWRSVLTGRYAALIWFEVPAMIKFWLNDTSENKEQTDVLIEKVVNFSFDVMGRTVLDSGFDLIKFLFVSK